MEEGGEEEDKGRGEQDKMYKEALAAAWGHASGSWWQRREGLNRVSVRIGGLRLLFRGNGQAGGRGKGRCLLMGLLARPLLPVATTGRRAEHAQCPVAVDEYSAGAAS